ncbi:PREDICTED: uncharacterized protein LOC105456024 [Wasmannia auropunctata]|uniref:uncharacterized protein LOC105456024 n=1 Tax=Wasmannia auropunctata TaxID=64793 RepID=UPI0005EE8E7A|nr:PREDICTED: uncharacterized protein LOC105456024 [Wasmannia auropunctata]
MKFALVLLAFVAASAAAPWKIPNVGRGELANELQEFLNLLPQQEITDITLQYYAQDAEFQAMIRYFKSTDFKQLIQNVRAIPEYKDLLEYVYYAGIDVYELQNALNKWLEMAAVQSDFAIDKHITGGIRGYVDDIKAAIRPVKNQLTELYKSKMQNSKVFQDFIAQLKSPKFQQLVNKVHEHPKFQELLKHAEKAGIDLKLVRDFLKAILGLDFPSYSVFQYRAKYVIYLQISFKQNLFLQMKLALVLLAFVAMSTMAQRNPFSPLAQELQDFVDLLPEQEIYSITLKYYTQDAEFQAMIRYFKSYGFKQFVKYIEALPEMKCLIEYLYDAGLEVYKLQDLLNNWLGITQTNFVIDKEITGGIRGYIDDISAAIRPVKDTLIALYKHKMKNSKVFQDFVAQLKSPNFQQLVYKVYVHPECQKILEKAKNVGIDLENILKKLFPIEVPPYPIF